MFTFAGKVSCRKVTHPSIKPVPLDLTSLGRAETLVHEIEVICTRTRHGVQTLKAYGITTDTCSLLRD